MQNKKEVPQVCFHRSLVPLELQPGKLFSSDEVDGDRIDWSANIINAHRLRVTKYLCTQCREVIDIPLNYTNGGA